MFVRASIWYSSESLLFLSVAIVIDEKYASTSAGGIGLKTWRRSAPVSRILNMLTRSGMSSGRGSGFFVAALPSPAPLSPTVETVDSLTATPPDFLLEKRSPNAAHALRLLVHARSDRASPP